ncbi:MAG: hypothetical protein KC983_08540 [Phycisphaerales bacterium]|nr:hypothetical protein [Phycisphaerales bacterium]
MFDESNFEHVHTAPADDGELILIVRRPDIDQRETLDIGELSAECGLIGDNWHVKPCRRTDDGSPHPDMQLNIINIRLLELIEPDRARWPLAGDQLYVDLDLREENLPAGTRLAIGDAVVEVTDQPHTGCAKFAERFGRDAALWVNSPRGRALRLRGINARTVVAGTIRTGDRIHVQRG